MPETPIIRWRYHDSTEQRVRVWLNTWPGDTFEIMPVSELTTIREQFQRFGIPIQAADDEERGLHGPRVYALSLIEQQVNYLHDLLDLDDGENWEGSPDDYDELHEQIDTHHSGIHGPREA